MMNPSLKDSKIFHSYVSGYQGICAFIWNNWKKKHPGLPKPCSSISSPYIFLLEPSCLMLIPHELNGELQTFTVFFSRYKYDYVYENIYISTHRSHWSICIYTHAHSTWLDYIWWLRATSRRKFRSGGNLPQNGRSKSIPTSSFWSAWRRSTKCSFPMLR